MDNIKSFLIAFAQFLLVLVFAAFQYGRYEGKQELKADAAVPSETRWAKVLAVDTGWIGRLMHAVEIATPEGLRL